MVKKNKTIVDPVTLSVIWNKLLTITQEMGDRVCLTSQSFIMALVKDLAPALMNTEGDIIATADFLPVHCMLADIPTKHILEKFGKLNKGDMALANDPHIVQSGHLPDWTQLIPLYWKNELVFYVHFRGHVMDTGGAYGGGYWPRAYDIIAEGLNIPPLKIVKKGKVDQELKELIFDNIRTAPAVFSDMMVIYGSAMKMQEDLAALVDKYGLDSIKACADEMIRRGEQVMRKQIKSIPDGTYYGESACDWDGTTPDKQIWVRLKMTIKRDEMTLDFSDSDEQCDFVNSPLGNTHSLAFLALFLSFDPDMPHNQGAKAPVHIIAPPGKVVNCTRPHTVGACACSVGIQIYESILEALGKAIPENTQAPWSRHFSVNIQGRTADIDPRTGFQREYFAAPFLEEGGSGAVKGFDGWDGITAAHGAGVTRRGSVEEQELVSTFRYEILNLRPDSEGAGEFVGARGMYAERLCTAGPDDRTILMSGDTDGQTYAIKGVAGAPPSTKGEHYIQRAGKKKKDVFRTMEMTDMYNGDVLITKSIGAGGWGDPLDRNPERVKFNAMEGLLSFNRAKDVYGVVLTQKVKGNPKTIEIDYAATKDLRKRMKAKQSNPVKL